MPPKKKDEDKGKDTDAMEVEGEGEGEGEGEPEIEHIDGDEEGEEEDESDIGEGEYEVEAILDHKLSAGKYTYLVAWKGYGPEHNTWEPEANVNHANEIVQKYWSGRPKPDLTRVNNTGKRGRPLSASQGPRKGVKIAGRRNGRKEDSEDESILLYEDTHKDEASKFMDVESWEDLVETVDTIERGPDSTLLVYLSMKTGEKIAQPTEVAYMRCPQQVLKFYEAHLKWKVA